MHISEVTLSFLHDEFEVEPAHGERREEMLRQAGYKTYFITRVIKPFVSDFLIFFSADTMQDLINIELKALACFIKVLCVFLILDY